MGNRLSAIATRTGDKGTTGLGDGSRVPKDCLRIEAIGTVDELNSFVGLLLTEVVPAAIAADLSQIQHDLFDVGAELCIPGHIAVVAGHVEKLDEALARYNAELPALVEFILPGGSKGAALAHVARSVSRRCERTVVRMAHEEQVNEDLRRYLNRLSDLLFVMARSLNLANGRTDVYWTSPQSRVKEGTATPSPGSE